MLVFFFQAASQAPSFLCTHFLLLSKYTTLLYLFTFLSLFLSPSFPSSPALFPLPSILFLFPFFFPGKFEHFSYLPGSAASTESRERVAEWIRQLTRKPKVRLAEVRIPRWTVWSLSITLARVEQSHVREIW